MAGNLQRRRPADRVVLAMLTELQRQIGPGGLSDVGMIDGHARVHIAGSLDLAALAHATEFALTTAFPALGAELAMSRTALGAGAHK